MMDLRADYEQWSVQHTLAQQTAANTHALLRLVPALPLVWHLGLLGEYRRGGRRGCAGAGDSARKEITGTFR